MFAEALTRGLAAAGWVIGFVSAASGFAAVLWLVIRVFIWAANGEESHADD